MSMKFICWSVLAVLCVLSADVEGAGSKRPREVERHARRKQEHKYNHRDPETREKLTCDLCPPGTHWVEHCTKQQTTKCQICPEDHYTTVHNKAKECVYCNEFCTKPNQRVAEGCTKTQNRRCECLPGHYLNRELCSPHKYCPPGKGVARTGTSEKNTRCGKCERGYFSAIRSPTAPCRKQRDCSLLNLSIIDSGNRFRDTICGDMEEPTHPPVVSVLNVTYDAEMPDKDDLLLSATLPKPGSHPSSSTLLQSLQNVSQSPDEQLVRATTAIQLSGDQLTSDSSTLADFVNVAEEEEEEEPCNSTVSPFMAYSDTGNLTAVVDQSTRNDSIREVDDIEDFQTGSQMADLPMPMSSHYYTGESQENGAVENPVEESMLPEFADSVMANMTEGPTAPPSLETVAEIPSLHGAPDQHYENQIIQEERMDLTTVTINPSQHPSKPPTKMDGTDTPALDVAEVSNDMGQGDKDLGILVVMSLFAAMLAFSSVTCVFVVVHPICRSQVYGAILQLWPRTTPEAGEPPRYADNDNSNVDDNASVMTGSDDTQSVVVDIDDVTDPKACAVRPLSLASSVESVRDAFRDAQVYISEHIGINWRSLSNHLPGKRLTEVQLDCIEDENRRVVERAMKMLVQWKELNGSRANVERMAKGLEACGQKKIACKVREMGL
ncbi:uncharacterized protein LOC144925400 [Branchiostoma floridae x Branchiostoma belcheri]